MVKTIITTTIDYELQAKIKDIAKTKLRCSVSKIVNDHFWDIVQKYENLGGVKK